MAQPLMTGAAPPPGTPAFQPGCPPGGPNMFHGALPQGQPYIMVSAGAQPPQVRRVLLAVDHRCHDGSAEGLYQVIRARL